MNPLEGSPITLDSILDSLQNIAQFMLFAGALIAVIFLVWGGIKWMSAKGDQTKAGDAKKMILNGLIGAMIVFGVGTLLATADNILKALSGRGSL